MKNPRQSKIQRETHETQIALELKLDGSGIYEINTPVPFLNHMLESFAKHGLFDLKIKAEGDVDIDLHHTVEDVGIVLGEAFKQALGNKSGITRFGSFTLPMDEVLTTVAIDFGGRPYFVYEVPVSPGRIGNFDVELVPEFFQAFVNSAQINLHLKVWYGKNRHHIVESLFKGFARALSQAVAIDPRRQGVASTKGTL